MVLCGVTVWSGAISMGSTIETLPAPVHRILGSLPGVYQTQEAVEAMAGLDFRKDLRMRFYQNEFWKHPWFGRGQVGDFFVASASVSRDHRLFFDCNFCATELPSERPTHATSRL